VGSIGVNASKAGGAGGGAGADGGGSAMSVGEADWRRAWSNGGGLGSTRGTASGSRSTGRTGVTTSNRRSSVNGLVDSTGSTDWGGGVGSPLSLRRIRIKQSRQFAVPHRLSWPAYHPQVKTRRMFHVKH
jgi:hypothetical protein